MISSAWSELIFTPCTLEGAGDTRFQVSPPSRAAPQSSGMRIHRLGIPRIEDKEIHDATEIEHPPRSPAVVRDVGTSHVARNQHRVDVMRADRWIEHRPATTGTDRRENPPGRSAQSAGQAHYNKSDDDGIRIRSFISSCLLAEAG